MQINITFFVQLFNICLTLWFLRRFFWTPLLTVVLQENQHNADNFQKKINLEKNILNDAEYFDQQRSGIIQKIHVNFIKIHKNKDPKKCIESDCFSTPPSQPNYLKIQSDAEQIASVIQGKFS